MLKKVTLIFCFLSAIFFTSQTVFAQVYLEYGESLNIKDYDVAHTNTFMPYGAVGVYQDIKDITFNNDGTAMFYVFDNAIINPPNANSIYNALIQKYTLSTPYDFSTRSFHSEKDLSTDVGVDNPENIKFNTTGSRMYILDDNLLRMYTLSSPYNITTASLTFTVGLAFYIDILTGFTFSYDGSELYITGRKNSAVPITRGVYQFSLETPFDISSEKTYQGILNTNTFDENPQDVEISADGKKMIVVGQATNKFIQYTLNTPFDVTTAVFSKNMDFSAQQMNSTGFTTNKDGSKLYLSTAGPVNTIDTYVIDNKTLTESTANDGTFLYSEAVKIALIGDTFSTTNSENLGYTVTGLPEGFTYNFSINASKTFGVFRLFGSKATHHRSINAIDHLVFNFEDSAFTNTNAVQVGNSTNYNSLVNVAFIDPVLSFVSAMPTKSSGNISLESPITITFNDVGGNQIINSDNISITGSQTGLLSGSFTGLGNSSDNVTFTPASNFKAGEQINITISNELVVNPKSYLFKSITQPGTPASTTSPKLIVSNTAGDATNVVTGDINGDGFLDIVAASLSADKVSWYENDGQSPPNFTEHILSNTIDGAWNVNIGDINKDGHLDILVVSIGDDTVAWYRNDGNASPNFTQYILSNTFDNPRDITSGDINNDGFIDIVAASYNQDEIIWFENNGQDPATFTSHTITTTANGVRSIDIGDIDGDGDLDIVSASFLDNTIAWYKNNGTSSPTFTKQIVDANALNAQSVKIGDIDANGYLDLITASSGDNTIAWYKNDGDSNAAFGKYPITFNAQTARCISFGDLDGDGLVDILSASSLDNKIAWYKNNGGTNPLFTEYIVTTTAENAFGVTVGDLDGNGTLDIVSASQSDNTVAWYPTETSTLNVDPITDVEGMIIYPNPVNTTVTIQNINNISLTEITIYDLSGRLVKTLELKNTFITTMDVSDLNSATYILKIKSTQGISFKKLIKY